jgi:UDP-glucose 4-epimerase
MNDELNRKSILVTGGTGFIGNHLVESLLLRGANVSILCRNSSTNTNSKAKIIRGDLTQVKTLEGICHNIDIVFHLGGHVHAAEQSEDEANNLNWQVTVKGTQFIVDQAVKSCVKRFLLFSSVKVMGEGGPDCLNEEVEPQPVTEYGKAKREAEMIVQAASRHGLQSTIFRLPMVYGPHCKGNLPRMIKAISRGRFPPFPEVRNKRSMVDVRDVVQAAMLAVSQPVAVDKIYLVTDDQVYSTRMIYLLICQALHHPVPRWTLSPGMMKAAGHVGGIVNKVIGRSLLPDTSMLNKFVESAWYCSDRINRDLNFKSHFTLQDSLPDMVKLIITQ